MNAETPQTRTEDPSSERWLEYYREAKVRRRARPRGERTRVRLKRWRNRQRTLLLSGLAVVGVLVTAFYVVLAR